ncbi:hypothetical protein MAH1_16980 [Sessilibacter sp. MAH1]
MAYWEQELSKNTPVGTSKSDVAAYLDSKKLSHGCHRVELQCYALDKDIESYIFVTFSAVLVFKFNEELSLLSYEVNQTGDGP